MSISSSLQQVAGGVAAVLSGVIVFEGADGVLLHYNGMLVGSYDVFSARSGQLEAELKSMSARRDYWMTRDELERAVGGSLRSRPVKQNSSKNP